jgi:FKBP-type peptidyl-prolyl cis-trans isomerase
MSLVALRPGFSALAAVVALAVGAGCSRLAKDAAADSGATSSATGAPEPGESESPPAPPAEEKLTLEDLVIGKGAEAKVGDHIAIHYVATLADTGAEFDSSRARGQPFELDVGRGRVIRGWDQGMIGMRVGGTRRVTIPPSFGYGDPGAPPLVPPKSTLIFEIELLSVNAKKAAASRAD